MRLAALLPLALSVALSASSASAAVAASNGLVTTAGSSPLILFLHGIGRQVAETVLLFGIPEQQVVSLQFNRVPARLAWSTTLAAYGLASCETRIPSVVVAGAPERIAPVCRSMGVPLERWGAAPDPEPVYTIIPGGAEFQTRAPFVPLFLGFDFTPVDPEPPQLAAAPDDQALPAPVQPDPVIPSRYDVRVRLLELVDNDSSTTGVDWSAGLLPALLGSAVAGLTGGAFIPRELANSIAALERSGVARKLDDVTLKLTEDQATRFQSGGVLQLSLVGSGDNSSIQRTVNYGLLLNLTPRRQGEALSVDVQADLSSPVSINNPALLDVATRSVTSSVLLRPGVGQVVATFMSRRDEQNTSGLPGLSTSPAVGWLAGRSSSSAGSSLVVVTVELVEVL